MRCLTYLCGNRSLRSYVGSVTRQQQHHQRRKGRGSRALTGGAPHTDTHAHKTPRSIVKQFFLFLLLLLSSPFPKVSATSLQTSPPPFLPSTTLLPIPGWRCLRYAVCVNPHARRLPSIRKGCRSAEQPQKANTSFAALPIGYPILFPAPFPLRLVAQLTTV